jgi:lipopolysaccharide transport system permease protein
MLIVEISASHSYFPDLRAAWQHRSLAFALAKRNIKARYMQTLLGSIWIVIQPVLLTGALTLIFGILLSVPTDGISYALFAFTGTLVWSGFQRALIDTGMSLAGSGSLILKVYFPRILIPVSAIFTAAIDVLPVYVLLLVVSVGLGQFPGWVTLLSAVFMLMALVLALAIGLWVTVLDAVFRDVRLVVPSVLQLVFYATPIMYSESIVPDRWKVFYHVNPLVGIVTGFRWSTVVGAAPPGIFDLAWTCGFTVALLAGGFVMFARLENFAVDRI